MNILSNSIEFYNQGFFGYGDKGDFKYFSFWHFLPIIILIASIILTYIFREKIKAFKHEKAIRLTLGIAMIIVEMSYFWRILYVGGAGNGKPDLLSKLPFQVCEWTCILAAIMVLTENKTCFDIDVVICLTLGIAPLILPSVIRTTGPKYYRYYQFWLEHSLSIYAVFYMMFIKDYKYDIKKIYKPFIFLFILSACCVYLNYKIPHASYMYLQGDELGKSLTNILPANQFGRLGIFFIITIILFGLEFLVFYLIGRRKNNKQIEQNVESN